MPDGTFTLAVEADDTAAANEHAAFADKCQPVLDPEADPEQAGRLKAEVISQLGSLRRAVAASGLGYLGALAGRHHDRTALVLLGIAAAPMEFPDGIDPLSLVAVMLGRQYPGAVVEEFVTADGVGVGIRRCEGLPLPLAAPEGQPVTVEAGISQALVPFPDAGLLGTVTGFCFSDDDIDLATVFTATIAHGMTVIQRSP